MSDQAPKMKAMFGGKPGGGFFDLPLARPGDTRDADVILLGAPAATPYPSVGNYCATAPDAIRNAFGWPGVLDHHDFDIGGKLLPEGVKALDWGNLDYSYTDFDANRVAIRDHVTSILATGAVPSTALRFATMSPAFSPQARCRWCSAATIRFRYRCCRHTANTGR